MSIHTSDLFDLKSFDIEKYDSVIQRGLCYGVGTKGGQMCIEAAVCYSLGLPHGDNPNCVADSVRTYKIQLNDSDWSSEQARAKGLRELGIAQLGSLGVVDDTEFTRLMAERTIRILIPALFREVFQGNKDCLDAADRCEKEGSVVAARAAAEVANADSDANAAAANAAYAAANAKAAKAAAYSAANADDAVHAAYYAARAAAYSAANADDAAKAANANASSDKYLLMSAGFAIEVLKELKSPGCQLLERLKAEMA